MALTLRILLISVLSLWMINPSFAQMTPEQASNALTGKDAAFAIGEAMKKDGVLPDVRVTIDGVREDDTLAVAEKPMSSEVDGLTWDKTRSRWQASLLLKAGGKNLAPLKLSGHYDEMTQIPVVKHRLMPGDLISQDDIEWSSTPVAGLRKNTVTDPKDIIGKSPKHMISEDRPIRADEVATPAIINKGGRVTLLYRSGNLEIKTLGEAVDSGAKGDVIRVRNVTSKTIIQGTVETSELVRVTSPDSTSAEVIQ